MEKQKEINVGVIVRRSPNKSPWLKWSWKPICLLPGSVDKNWKLIREESGIFDYHVGHDKPESQGGTLDIDNIKPICARCNLSMSDNYTIEEWQDKYKKESKKKKFLNCF